MNTQNKPKEITYLTDYHKMTANYHAHTWRCNHAQGTEREYIERAIEAGLTIMGFSDHTPMPYDNGYIAGYRMELSQLEGYVDTVLALKKEYENDIELHLGLEVEYYPKYWKKLQNILEPYPIEYCLLGQHCLGNEIGDASCFEETYDENRLRRYCDQVKEALSTGAFLYLAHPDLLHYVGRIEVYEKYMRDLCIFAKEHNIPLEINLQGAREGRHYPDAQFWKIAGEVGCSAIYGCDAHQTPMAYDAEGLAIAAKIAEENHLKVIETLPL